MKTPSIITAGKHDDWVKLVVIGEYNQMSSKSATLLALWTLTVPKGVVLGESDTSW